MRVSGTLLDVQRKHGSFTDRTTGNDVAYDFTLLHILDGREVNVVRLPSEVSALDLPFGKGDVVDVSVSVPVGTKVSFVGLPV